MIDLTQHQYLRGDFLKLVKGLRKESIDLIYTDPPYGMRYKSNIPGSSDWFKKDIEDRSTVKSPSKFDSEIDNDDGSLDWKAILAQFYRILKPDSFLVIHCNIKLLSHLVQLCEDSPFVVQGVAVWNKRFAIGGNLKRAMKRDWEPILYITKGSPRFHKVRVQRPVKIGKGKEWVSRKRLAEHMDWSPKSFMLKKYELRGFATQKPLRLCARWIHLTTRRGAVVLDAFAGSASIGRACKATGRIGISFEINPEVHEKYKGFLQEEIILTKPKAAPDPDQMMLFGGSVP
jgi:DNA modification methylase